jgi:PKD repeat protein/outer membrane lipoprotein-sorting protein
MKKKLLLYLVCLLLLITTISAQTKFVADRIENRSVTNLNSHFKDYSIFNINTSAIVDFTKNQKGINAVFELQLPGLTNWEFSIAEHDILSKDYTLTVNTPSGRTTMPKTACKTYRGYLSNVNDSRVSLTLDNSIIYGMIKSGDKEYFIEPLNYLQKGASPDVFVVYDTKDVLSDPNLTCGATETWQRQNIVQRQNQVQRTEAGLTCVRTELAIASDASMFTRYVTVAGVETHNIGVMNNVIWDYVNAQFDYNIEFLIVTQNVSLVAGTDQLTPLYAGTDVDVILPNFSAWAAAGGFGVTHDIGQFWTTRDLDTDGAGGGSGVIGFAYVGSVCVASLKYHILEDFTGSNPTGSGYQLRVLTSHEIGHNFNCVHDGAGSGFIMQPSVGNTSTWSAVSVAAVDLEAPTLACLGACSVSGAPLANFIASPEGICTGGVMTLKDHSLNGPTSWSWTMTGGVPSASVVRNPTVTYASSGIKTISFTSTNGAGSSIPNTKKILVSAAPAIACSFPGVSASTAGVKSFSLNNINKVSGSAAVDGSKYMDFSCSDVTSLLGSTLYSAIVNVGASGPIFNHVRFYIDYNNDGDFLDVSELVYTSGGTGYVGNHTFTFTTIAPLFYDVFLRARIIAADFGSAASSCHDPAAGQVEDYSVFFASPTLLSSSRLDLDGYHQNGVNILNWQTVNETDNNYFEIERSTDGATFIPIGRLNSNTAGNNSYTFTDPLTGITGYSRVYYRLRIVEFSGPFTYSKIVPITIKNLKNDLLVNLHPNPFSDAITATIQINTAGSVRVELIDLAGRIVYKNERKLPAGINTVTYNSFDNLSNGAYLIKISYKNKTISRLVEKQ